MLPKRENPVDSWPLPKEVRANDYQIRFRAKLNCHWLQEISIEDEGKTTACNNFRFARHAGDIIEYRFRAPSRNDDLLPSEQAAIQAAIEQLGYRPDKVAQGLVNGASMTIGVLTQHLASPFYGEILMGIETGLSGSPYTPIIVPGNWHLNEEVHALDVLLERRVDAMIILGGDIPDSQLLALAEEIPFVLVGRRVEALQEYCVTADNHRGAYQATRYLIDLGHTQIAHITGSLNQLDAIQRRDGYFAALENAGIKMDLRLVVEGDFRERSGLLALENLLTRNVLFSAIFAANDQMADGVLLGLYSRGLRVPDDISLIGFDDQPGSAYTIPPLTTVRQPAFEMGAAAAKGALALLAGESANAHLSTELILRTSTIRFRHQRSFLRDRRVKIPQLSTCDGDFAHPFDKRKKTLCRPGVSMMQSCTDYFADLSTKPC